MPVESALCIGSNTCKSKTCSHDAGGMGWVAVKKQKMGVAAADLSVTHALNRYVHV